MDSKQIVIFGIISTAALLLGLGMAFSFKLFLLLFFGVISITLLLMGRAGMEIGFLVLVFSLPFQYVIPNNMADIGQLSQFIYYFGPSLSIILVILLLASFIQHKTRIKKTNNFIVLMLLLFFIMEFLSYIFAGGGESYALFCISGPLFNQLIPFIVLIATYYVCSDIKMVKLAISAFMLTAPIVIGLGYLEKISNTIIFTTKPGLVDSDVIQVASTFWDPNQLGRYLVIIIMLALPFIIYENKTNIWNIFLSIAALILLIFTRSTSDMLSLFIAVIIFVSFSKNFRSFSEETYKTKNISSLQSVKYLLFGIGAISLAITLCILFKEYFVFALNKLLSFQTSGRFNMDMAGIAMFISSPLYGVGFGRFGGLFGKFNPLFSEYFLGLEPGSHNSLIKVAAEMGVLGLIPLLYIYYYFIKITLISGRAIKNDQLRTLQLSLGALWIAMIINGWAYWRFFEDPRIWFVAGLALAINNLREGIQSDEISSR